MAGRQGGGHRRRAAGPGATEVAAGAWNPQPARLAARTRAPSARLAAVRTGSPLITVGNWRARRRTAGDGAGEAEQDKPGEEYSSSGQTNSSITGMAVPPFQNQTPTSNRRNGADLAPSAHQPMVVCRAGRSKMARCCAQRGATTHSGRIFVAQTVVRCCATAGTGASRRSAQGRRYLVVLGSMLWLRTAEPHDREHATTTMRPG